MDPQHRLLLELAWEAHEDAGIPPQAQKGSATGVFVGISSNDYGALQTDEGPDAYSNTGSAVSVAANRISYQFDFRGPSFAVDTACSSSLVAVHQACASLLAGECSAALAGGVGMLLTVRPWQGFCKASMLSPTGRCKSFDAAADGFVRAEGGGLVLLKRLADAERDGDRILAVIHSTGVNQDGRTMGLSLPNGDAQEALLRQVYAGANPDDVVYVEAHGTGTAVGDPIECGALGRVLGQSRAAGRCLIGSVKSNIGHLEAAAGIAGLTKAVLALKYRQIPPNLHFREPNPKIDFESWNLEVVTRPVQLPARQNPAIIGVNSFGFGGTNAHVALREYRPKPSAAPSSEPGPGLLLISARSEAALRELARSYADQLARPGSDSWLDICAAAALCRGPHPYRLVVAAGSKSEAAARLENYLAGTAASKVVSGKAEEDPCAAAFVYSGNGPQWWGMGRELLAENAVFREELEAIDAIFAPLAGWSLIAEMRRPESESRMGLTEVAQPMLFALQLGLTQVLRANGISPAAVLGHSVGEVAAAWASGALTREQATEVIFHRSMAQSATAGKGRMAALGVSAGEARAAMAQTGGWLELAAVNAPAAVTVAGGEREVEKLVQHMTAAGKFARMLPLNYPFHTRAMEPIRERLVAALDSLAPGRTAIPFLSTVTGTELDGTALDAGYWYRNVRDAVQFHPAVTDLIRSAGIAVFVEIGPHPVLKDYVLQSAKEAAKPVVALSTLRRPSAKGPEPESENLETAICACHANGAGEFRRLFRKPAIVPALPLYPWQRTRHWRGCVLLPDLPIISHRDHPLLGYRVPSRDGLWENTLDSSRLTYLKDHVIQKSVLFPLAGYVEMALAGAERLNGGGILEIEDLEVLRPLAIPAQSDPLVQVMVDAGDGTFEIRSRAGVTTQEWTANAKGRVSRIAAARSLEKRSIDGIASGMPHIITSEAHYLGTARRGLEYGAAFQGVRRVLLTPPSAEQREALAEVELAQIEGLDAYRSHPSLFDCCLQTLITLIAQNERRDCCTVPVHIGRARSFAALPNRVSCHVRMRKESELSAVADFVVMDGSGQVLLTIEDARCQKVDFQRSAPTLIADGWRLDPRARTTGEGAGAPSAAAIAAAMRDEGTGMSADAVRPKLDRLAGAYAAEAIRQLWPAPAAFDLSRLARKGGVRREQMGLLNRLVRMAEEDGRLARSNGLWQWSAEGSPEPAEKLWRELFLEHPHYQAELQLLAEAGGRLTAKLKGEEESDVAALRDQLEDTAPSRAPYNRLARSTVEKIVAAWAPDQPIRVLELGGSGGGLAAWLLPAFPAARTDYVFTDGSEAALGRAERRFAAHRFVRFHKLDEDKSPDRDLPSGYFDLIIGCDAALLERVKPTMAPGAVVLAIQPPEDRFAQLCLEPPRRPTFAGFDEVEAIGDGLVLARRMSGSSPAATAPSECRRMLVFECGDPLRDALPAVLPTAGVYAFTGTGDEQKAAISQAIDREKPEEIVYISGTDSMGGALLETQTRRCLTAVCLAQVLESRRGEVSCRLTLVTRGAFPAAHGQGPLDPGQSPLWGLGRVLGNEHPALETRLIDLHSTAGAEQQARTLAGELLHRDEETEVQLFAGHRYVTRHRGGSLLPETRVAGQQTAAFALAFEPHGGLDSLHLGSLEREAPGPDQVEIAVKAAGLNFRDVLWAMGMLPEEAVEQGFSGSTIGMECSGEIVRTGANVTSWKPGDRVVAFASSCFASHVTTSANSIAAIPEGIGYSAAATIPTTFLTAWYGLDCLARLESGETVLIHGAAGGVGLAAIQIAKLKGAKVIGTAGTARKRRLLEMLGVDHALSSRSLDFADQVKEITGGEGVDVVLNSLAGEAITKSLHCLRPFGRFLEIGKRDLYANSRIGLRPFRNNLSYFGIDADTLLSGRPGVAKRIFEIVMRHFASGALKPLPYQVVPVSRATEAFRAMQQSKHVGKLVVSMELDRPETLTVLSRKCPVRPGVTYLVTGGGAGFGLATAEWLVEQGATSLVLASRRGASTAEAAAAIQRLEQKGAQVRVSATDVSDAAAVTAMVEEIRAGMPPLAGIIHSAALIEDAPIANLSAAQLERVFAAKLQGARNLHQATLADRIELFVLYSSSSALVGNPGQGAYVAANLYLDSLAAYRRSIGLPALSVAWGAIKDAGFLTRHQSVAAMLKTRTGMDATPAADALEMLGRLLAAGVTRVTAARFDLEAMARMLPSARAPRFRELVPKDSAVLQTETTLAESLRMAPEANRRELALARVREHGARVLGTSSSQMNIDRPLAELGLDSLMAVELAGGLERDLQVPVPVMHVLSAGSISAITELVLKAVNVST